MGSITRNFTGTLTSTDGTSYTYELDIRINGSISDELATDTYLYNTDNRYTNHGVELYPQLRIKNSSGNYVYPSLPYTRLRLTVGYDTFECDLNGKPIYTDSTRNCSYLYIYFSDTIYRAYTPGSSSRSSDSIKAEFISTSTSYPSGTVTGTLTYPPYYQASAPTTNYAIVKMGQTLTINTNRINSSITHTIRYSITSNNGYKIYDTTKTDYTTGNRWISGSGSKTLATNVGASYSWTIPSTTSSLFYSSSMSDGFYDLVIFVESFYSGMSLGVRSVVVKLFKANGTNTIYGGFNYVQLNDTALSTTYSRKHFVAGKSNITVSGQAYIYVNRSGYNFRNLHHSAIQPDGSSSNWRYYYYSNTSSNSQSFTISNVIPYNSDTTYDVSWGDYRYKPGIRDFRMSSNYEYGNSSGGATSTSDNVTIDYYISPYSSPKISLLNVYRVDSTDTADIEGTYLHIQCNCSTTCIGTKNNRSDGSGESIHDMNSIQLVMKYKKSTDSSWSSTTLVPTKYENYISFNGRYTGNTFDATSTYEVRFELTDKFETTTRSITLKPPIILIDYNNSGKSLAFGKISEASASDTIIESIFPIIFYTDSTTNRVTALNSSTNGIITQHGTNSTNYFNVFRQTTSTGGLAYGITCKDVDSNSSDPVMRLNCFQSRLDIYYRKMQYYQWATDYYWEVNPESTYCNINTNSSYFNFNKPIYVEGNIYMSSNLVATQTWATNQFQPKNSNITIIGGDTKSSLTDFNSYYGQNKMYLGTTSETRIQVHWGLTEIGSPPSSYSDQYVCTKTISFTTSFGKPPVVIATPNFNRPSSNNWHWETTVSIVSVSTSSFTVQTTAKNWTGTSKIFWLAIGSY